MNFDNTAALDLIDAAPLAPPKPAEKRSWWADLPNIVGRSLGSAVPAAFAEGLAAAAETATATAKIMDRSRRAPNSQAFESQLGTPVSGETEFSRSLRNAAESFRPDPATASTAEQVVFGGLKGVTKAVGYTLATGNPLAGAAAFAGDEGLAMFDELQRKGVDDETAAKGAVFTGLASGASILIPGAAATIPKTVALTAAGGPAAYMAQQKVTSDILKEANYPEIAAQFDPLDPVGLMVATLIPAAFGGAHVAKLSRAAKPARPEAIGPAAMPADAPAPSAPPGAISPDVVDAAMVHNLSLQQDIRPPAELPPLIEPPRAPPEPAAAKPAKAQVEEEQTALQQRVAAVEQADPEAAATLKVARQEAQDGTDAELGRVDAELLRVAAECAFTA